MRRKEKKRKGGRKRIKRGGRERRERNTVQTDEKPYRFVNFASTNLYDR